MRLSSFRRFIVIQGVIVLLLVFSAFYTATNLNRSLALTINLTNLQEGVQATGNIIDALEDERIAIGQYPLTGSEDLLTRIADAQNIYDENWQIVTRVFGSEQPELLSDIEESRATYVEYLNEIISEYQSNPDENDSAGILRDAINYYLQNLGPKIADLSEPAVQKLVNQVETERARANQLAIFSRIALGFSVVVGILVVVLVIAVVIFSRRMLLAIQSIVDAANDISRGDMDVPIDVEQGGEIGELAQAIDRMRTSLRAAIERLRR
ncbi:MAG: HAMP domain-containing protein [Anaerolineales bacterium]|jgi:methyl-accepting chemotaxis protein